MSLGPILPGRLPSSLIARRLQQSLQVSNRELVRLQDQVATGRRFLLPSEAPAAAVRGFVLQTTLERNAQLRTNVSTSQSFVQASEAALTEVGDVLNRAKALALAGVGTTATTTEKQAMALEVAAMLRQTVDVANSQFRGRYLFGGSESRTAPFELAAGGVVRYLGDEQEILSFAESSLLIANNVDGITAFGAATDPVTRDLNPALSLDTPLTDLYAGQGTGVGPIAVTLDDGTTSLTRTVDLSNARTVRDVKTLLEDAFAGGPLTLTVDINPATGFGLRLTPSAGTVTVDDVAGSTVAADLGIAGSGAIIAGGDLDPRLTIQTTLASLNGGTGIGATAGFGLSITNGSRTSTVDLSSAVTVEDVLNAVRRADPDVIATINDAGNGISLTSRLSGAPFAIGENGGQNATRLGVRTFTPDTRLADLNRGFGVPVNDGIPLEITRRDGTTVAIDLAGTQTVQDVLDRINAVDPGVLTASLNTIGNGIAITDNDGASTGPLSVADNSLARALGIAGTESGADPSVALVGGEIHPRTAPGVFGLLAGLERALNDGDDRELQRLSGLIQGEIDRLNLVRGETGSRLQVLERIGERLADEEVKLQESLTLEIEVDLTEVITQVAQVQTVFEASLRVAAQTSQLTLLNYL